MLSAFVSYSIEPAVSVTVIPSKLISTSPFSGTFVSIILYTNSNLDTLLLLSSALKITEYFKYSCPLNSANNLISSIVY